jgi:hypothetical protein
MLRYFRGLSRKPRRSFGAARFASLSDFLDQASERVPVLLAEAPRRVACIGDLHGDLAVFWACLCRAGCIDRRGFWTGGQTHVVQVGDFLDRGGRVDSAGRNVSLKSENPREELEIMQYAYWLDQEARKAGGAVTLLSGNHEFMNFTGDFSCTTDVTNDGWGGVEARNEAFKPGGVVAAYFEARHPAMLKLGGLVFVHGGLGQPCAESDFDKYVLQVNAAWSRFLLAEFAGLAPCLEDALFSRRVSDDFAGSDDECERVAEDVFARVGLPQDAVLCVGHTPQIRGYQPTAGVNGVCENENGPRVWRLDVGASAAFGRSERAQVLVIVSESGQPPEFQVLDVTTPLENSPLQDWH